MWGSCSRRWIGTFGGRSTCPGSNELFTLTIWVEDDYFSPLSHPEYLRLREVGAGAEGFSLAAFGSLDFTMVAGDALTRVDVTLVSGDFFTLLGAAPTQGRLLAPSDDDPGGTPAVVVVSHGAWPTGFGRDPDLVGSIVRLGPQAFTVAGVAANPLPGPAHDPDSWVPLSAVHQLLPDFPGMLGPIAVWLDTVGRLDASASRGDAEVLAALARDPLPAESAEVRTGEWRFVARSVNHLRLGPEYHREAARFLTVLAVITGIFLLAACSTIVLMLLTRGAEQAHDLAVRRTLGRRAATSSVPSRPSGSCWSGRGAWPRSRPCGGWGRSCRHCRRSRRSARRRARASAPRSGHWSWAARLGRRSAWGCW